jgi:hypothetical protein
MPGLSLSLYRRCQDIRARITRLSDELTGPVPPLVEGEDYYFENGLMVFTAEYHRKRGYCCGSACRHCPYGNAPGDRPSDRRD